MQTGESLPEEKTRMELTQIAGCYVSPVGSLYFLIFWMVLFRPQFLQTCASPCFYSDCLDLCCGSECLHLCRSNMHALSYSSDGQRLSGLELSRGTATSKTVRNEGPATSESLTWERTSAMIWSCPNLFSCMLQVDILCYLCFMT